MSKKRKGLSVDEKRNNILKIYHEKQEPFNLKEIESLGAKAGVVQQTIKDINQSLCDDNLVHVDKFGASNIFWSFPQKVYDDQVLENKRQKATLGQLQEELSKLSNDINEAKINRKAPSRQEKLKLYNSLREQESQLDKELAKYQFLNSSEITDLQKKIELNKESANRWTDNIWSIQSFLVKKKGLARKEAQRALKIDSNFDYVS